MRDHEVVDYDKIFAQNGICQVSKQLFEKFRVFINVTHIVTVSSAA